MVEEDITFETFDGDIITKNELRQEVIDKYVTAVTNGVSQVTDFSTGSEALHLADVIAGFLLDIRALIDNNYLMSMIHTMQGEFLDNYGDMVGVHRQPASPSRGEVTFTWLPSANKENPLDIYDGTIVATDDSITFIVDLLDGAEKITLDTDVNSITVPVQCELDGAYTSVNADTISIVMDSNLANYVSVNNEKPFVKESGDYYEEGTDIEDDDTYRNRIIEAPGNAPTASLEWYNNVAMEYVGPDLTETINDVLCYTGCHDLRVDKSLTEADIDMIFNPVDRSVLDPEDLSKTRCEVNLTNHFNLTNWCVAGISINYILAEQVAVLVEAGYTFYFALLLEADYTLNMVKENVKTIITNFNKDANVSNEFTPSTLASLIENSVDGVSACKIVKYDTTAQTYAEVVAPVEMEDNEVYKVDMTSIDDRIVELSFNVCITPTE